MDFNTSEGHLLRKHFIDISCRKITSHLPRIGWDHDRMSSKSAPSCVFQIRIYLIVYQVDNMWRERYSLHIQIHLVVTFAIEIKERRTGVNSYLLKNWQNLIYICQFLSITEICIGPLTNYCRISSTNSVTVFLHGVPIFILNVANYPQL